MHGADSNGHTPDVVGADNQGIDASSRTPEERRNQVAPVPASLEGRPQSEAVEAITPLPFHLLPEIAQAQETFRRDLPQLLQQHPGQWVAYCGTRPIGMGTSKTELYQACLRQGYQRGHFLVRCIEPATDVLTTGVGVFGS